MSFNAPTPHLQPTLPIMGLGKFAIKLGKLKINFQTLNKIIHFEP
jgi:hypothetical protein